MWSRRSISRVLCPLLVTQLRSVLIPLELALPSALKQPTQGLGRATLDAPLRGLAPNGVYRATTVTGRAVGSYPTISPLLDLNLVGRFDFCGTFLEVFLTGRYPASCPAEPGLSSSGRAAGEYLAHLDRAHRSTAF